MTKKEERDREDWITAMFDFSSDNDEWICPCIVGVELNLCNDWSVLEQTWAMWQGLA